MCAPSGPMNLIPNASIPQPPCSSPFVSGLTYMNICSGDSANLFLNMLSMLATYSTVINGVCERIKPVTKLAPTYDFVVIGGGAGGSVVAASLSEHPDWSVLLVEAGPDEPAGTQIPSNLQVFLGTELDWKYQTTNESHACLSTNGSCSWPRGKNLGGCTSHHGMAYHRGHEKDYTRWVEMGNIGWSWQDVLPYFFKQEDNKEIGRVRRQDHGVGGPMTVERFPWQPQFAWDVLTAARQVGLGTTEDLVGPNITGFNIAQTISRNGVRLSTPRAFLWPKRDRPNLHVALNAIATKVLTKRRGSKVIATGIKLIINGREQHVNVRKEVVLSGGTINSPQILLLSGIGPKEHLKSVKIKPVLDLPGVGENLHNHQSYGLDFNINKPPIEELNINSANLYLYNQTGPMSSTGLAQLTALLASEYTTKDDPDNQIFFAGYQATCNTGDRIPDLLSYNNKETIRMTSVNVQPRSRGRLTLASNDPLSHPIIWGNDLAKPIDRKIIYSGIQKLIKLTGAPILKHKYNLTRINYDAPECDHVGEKGSYEHWDCLIQYDTRPENHQAGTCKMGPATDPMAVVDPSSLKVYGTTNIRVADASIMPQVISGNPVATINMIGERAGDFIKSDWL